MGYGLGVDLGTTFTAAAVERDGRVEMVTLGDRTAAVPSVVLVGENGQVLTGDAADRRAATDPDRVAREVKRRLGDPMPLVLGGSPHSAAQLMGLQLRDVVTLVSEREGGMPDAVTLTHPANWGPYKRELFDQVPRTAGLRHVRMITEPEAAAAHYAAGERLEDGALVAVYDLGGGTFDATVLRAVGHGFEILGAPEGIEGLGGIDFDEAVFSHVDRTLGGPLAGLDPADPRDTSAAVRLRQDCARAKEALSADTEATIPVLLPRLQTEVRLTRGEFESMISPAIGATIASLRRALLSAGVTPAHLKTVLLVGGSSRIPLVARMVSAELGRPTSVDAHPKHAIVLGAAAMAGSRHVDQRGVFTGPPTGGAPATTALGAGALAARTPPRPMPAVAAMPPAAAGAAVPPPALAASGTPAAGMPAPSLSGPEPRRRRRLPVLVGAAVLALALLGGGTVLYQSVSSATPIPPATSVPAPEPTPEEVVPPPAEEVAAEPPAPEEEPVVEDTATARAPSNDTGGRERTRSRWTTTTTTTTTDRWDSGGTGGTDGGDTGGGDTGTTDGGGEASP